MFKCRDYQICVHLSESCDNKRDCPLGDDEHSCSLNEKICPNLCQCSLFAIQCLNIRILSVSLQSIFFYNVVFISDCNIQVGKFSVNQSPYSILSFTSSHLVDICSIVQAKVILLEFSSNEVTSLYHKCFESVKIV